MTEQAAQRETSARGVLRRSLAGLPTGTLPIGVGLIVSGATVYGFLGVTARVLGPERYAALSVLWALVFLAGPGVFIPLEQEVGRTSAGRRATGQPVGAVLRSAAVLGAALSAVLVLVVLALSSVLLDELFDGQLLLLAGLVLALPGYALVHLLRGSLAGTGEFRGYSVLVSVEGLLRFLAAVVLAVVGLRTAGGYGLVVGLAPVAGVLVTLAVVRPQLGSAGPPMRWSQLTEALGFLLIGSVVAQLLINAGPLAVKLLADDDEAAHAGRLLAGLVLTRVPLYLFQAVQAALLPRLTALAAAGEVEAFRAGIRRLLLLIAGVTAVAVGGALLIGPPVLRLLFGEGFDLGRRDLALLAAASCAIMTAQALGQALVALHRHAKAALGWVAGAAVFFTVTLLGTDLLLRVELGLLAGAVTVCALLGATLARSVGRSPGSRSPVAGVRAVVEAIPAADETP